MRWRELVGDLADRGTTVFMTTHDLAGVEGIADGVGIMKDGSLLVNETMETLKARFRRLVWTASEDVPPARIEAGLGHLDVIGTGASGGTAEAVVS